MIIGSDKDDSRNGYVNGYVNGEVNHALLSTDKTGGYYVK